MIFIGKELQKDSWIMKNFHVERFYELEEENRGYFYTHTFNRVH